MVASWKERNTFTKACVAAYEYPTQLDKRKDCIVDVVLLWPTVVNAGTSERRRTSEKRRLVVRKPAKSPAGTPFEQLVSRSPLLKHKCTLTGAAFDRWRDLSQLSVNQSVKSKIIQQYMFTAGDDTHVG